MTHPTEGLLLVSPAWRSILGADAVVHPENGWLAPTCGPPTHVNGTSFKRRPQPPPRPRKVPALVAYPVEE